MLVFGEGSRRPLETRTTTKQLKLFMTTRPRCEQWRLDRTLGKKRAEAGKREKSKAHEERWEGKREKRGPKGSPFSLFPSYASLPFSLRSTPAPVFCFTDVYSLCGGERALNTYGVKSPSHIGWGQTQISVHFFFSTVAFCSRLVSCEPMFLFPVVSFY